MKTASGVNGKGLKAKIGKPSYAAVVRAECKRLGIWPMPEEEFKFSHGRKWCFDFAWRDQKVALEINGGVWSKRKGRNGSEQIGGRHNSGAGYLNDLEKLNAAVVAGWRVIQATPQMLESGEAMSLINEIL